MNIIITTRYINSLNTDKRVVAHLNARASDEAEYFDEQRYIYLMVIPDLLITVLLDIQYVLNIIV
jgi:thiosulfate reductase cytochrome b subunit